MRQGFGIVILTLLVLFCVSCSAGRNKTANTTGRAILSVRWPERTRLIPFAAESIRVKITSGASILVDSAIPRPEQGGLATVSFDYLPVGLLIVSATAHPNANGTGVAQAQGTTTATIIADAATEIRLTLASAIDRLELTPTSLALRVGDTQTLAPSPKNAAGATVLVMGATLEWTSSDSTIAAVVGGTVTAQKAGEATITVRETESGKSASATVVVTAVPTGNETVACNSVTGHCYERIVTQEHPGPFTDICASAESYTYQGMPGHILTLSDNTEFEFIRDHFTLDRVRIGAYQDRSSPNYDEPGGGWRWVTGEPWTYTRWRGGEPNNVGGGEDYVSLWENGDWNDAYEDDFTSYIVEYEPTPRRSGFDRLFFYDGFDYAANVSVEGLSGGTGWQGSAWKSWLQQGATPSVTTDTGLTFPNLKTEGRAYRTTSAFPTGNFRDVAPALHPEGSTLFFSFLVHPQATTGGSAGSFIGTRIHWGFVGGGKGFWGIRRDGGSDDIYSTVPVQANETYFLVIRVRFKNGPDEMALWVNPIPGQPLPATPALEKKDLDIGIATDIGSYTDLPVIYDEWRVGTSWEKVSPKN